MTLIERGASGRRVPEKTRGVSCCMNAYLKSCIAGAIVASAGGALAAIPSTVASVEECQTELKWASVGAICSNSPITMEIVAGIQCPYHQGCHDLAMILGLSEAGDAQRADTLTKMTRSVLVSLGMARNRSGLEYAHGMVVTFSETTARIVQEMTGDERVLLGSVNGLQLSPGPLGEQGLAHALDIAKEGIRRARLEGPLCAVIGLPQAIVVVTDAWPTSGEYLERAIADVRIARIPIIVICSGSTCEKAEISAMIGDDSYVFVDDLGTTAPANHVEDVIHDKGLERVVLTATMGAGVEVGPGSIEPPATQTGQSLVWDIDGWLGPTVTMTWPVLLRQSGDDIALLDSVEVEFHVRRRDVVRATHEPVRVTAQPCVDLTPSASATRAGTETTTPSSSATATLPHLGTETATPTGIATATATPTSIEHAASRIFLPQCWQR